MHGLDRDPAVNAAASATIAIRAIAALGASDLGAALMASHLQWGTVAPDLSWSACGLPHRHPRASDVIIRPGDHDPNHPFFQRLGE